ncbi:hypothetical protein QW131_32685 [Roseibium salinum]|nr:hypothetical protein [Roseibium salinum]
MTMKASTPVFPHDQSIECAEQHARHQGKAPADENDSVSQAREDRPGHAVEQDDGTEREGRADAQVDIAVDHDDGHADGDDADRSRLLEKAAACYQGP